MAKTPSTIPNASKVVSPIANSPLGNEVTGEEIENLEPASFMDELNDRLSAIENARVGLRSGADTNPSFIELPDPSAGGQADAENQNVSFYWESCDVTYTL